MKKLFYIYILYFIVGLFSRVIAQEKPKPNIILIFTDDHRYSGVHIHGNEQIHTPNIDQLAKEGVRFSNAYLMGAFEPATSVPSRANLMSGKNLFELKKEGREIPKEHTTMGEAFKNAGYHCHIVGKWHQDRVSLHRSFHSGNTIMGLGLYLIDQYRMPLWDWDSSGKFDKKNAYLLEYNAIGNIVKKSLTGSETKGPIGTEKIGPHTSEVFAGQAISFIEKYKENAPFFMYLAFHAPHDPRQAPMRYKEMYPEQNIVLPPSYMPQHPFDNGAQTVRDEALAPWPRTPEVAQKHLSDYYAAITHLDAQIGLIIDALKKSGQYDNTLIIFSGDSGLGLGSHGLMGKQNLYNETGLHVPFIISGNLIKQKDTVFDNLCYIHDIFPTICDFAGVSIPESVTGNSVMPILLNTPSKSTRTYTYHAYMQCQRALRKGDYKLIEYVPEREINADGTTVMMGSRVTQLFNLKNDPWELNNLAYLNEYQAIVKEMRTEIIKAAEKHQDVNNEFWRFYKYFEEVK